jgi:tetratricopeptide (TPR) repeat protein
MMFEWFSKIGKKAVSKIPIAELPNSSIAQTANATLDIPQKIGMALQHHQAGRLSDAQAIYHEVLAIDADNIDAFHFLGVIAYQRGDHEQAVQLISRALARNEANAIAQNNLGNVFKAQHKLDETLRCFQNAVAISPDYADAHINLGNMLKDRGQLHDAATLHQKAVALSPHSPDAHFALGNTQFALGKVEEAEESYRHLLVLRPDYEFAKFGYGLLKLLRGDYELGLPLYEERFNVRALTVAHQVLEVAERNGVPRWQGENIAGETLLVWTDQGLGDSLMAMRYLPLLKRRGFGKLIVYCAPELIRTVQTVSEVDAALPLTQPAPWNKIDYFCPIMSLPLLFKARVETIPNDVPYLLVPSALKRIWAQKLVDVAKPRAGFAWAGRALNLKDTLRSIPFERLSPLLSTTGVNFISLQKDDDEKQSRTAFWKGYDWMNECNDLLDTAALIEQLDIVISVDTAMAHLAGALGKTVWLLNRFESEWRWMLERDDSPWYPTMKIFRQRKPGDWDEVIMRVAAALKVRYSQEPSNRQ